MPRAGAGSRTVKRKMGMQGAERERERGAERGTSRERGRDWIRGTSGERGRHEEDAGILQIWKGIRTT